MKEGRCLELAAQLKVANCLALEAEGAVREELGPEVAGEDAV